MMWIGLGCWVAMDPAGVAMARSGREGWEWSRGSAVERVGKEREKARRICASGESGRERKWKRAKRAMEIR